MQIQKTNSVSFAALENELGFAGSDAWSNFIQRMYGYKIHRLAALENGELRGALNLLEIKHPIFGHYLVTAPYGSYGGFAYRNPTARDALLKEADQLARQLKVEYALVRGLSANASAPPAGWTANPLYCTYLIHLPAHAEDLLKTFSSDHRNHVRKSLKKGLSIRFGHLDLLEDAYTGLSKSMRELGSPYHSKDYLKTMAEHLGEHLEFAVVYDAQAQIAGAGIFIYQGKTVSNLHANILKSKRALYAGEFFYWSVIERGISKGLQTFDLGRSLIGSGNETFKMKWSPEKRPLDYWYWLAEGHAIPALNQKSPKFQLVIAIWKRLPAFVVNLFGPLLIRGLA
ncbi:MAG: peptidoglycan bridge formation glycyltransferase FemA/FemB family protein [Anaerolineales bacterium]|nr:peptidoglycan bridge formation glycyltransferase FemA/FemB family protein [Anaerolineales bacterium]